MKSMTVDKKTWYIAHNEMGIVHPGFIDTGQTVTTGQTVLETFESEIAWVARQVELGVPMEELL